MARVPQRFTLDEADVKPENLDVLQKLAAALNPFVEDVVGGMEGRLDFNNLNMGVININVRVDATGRPLSDANFRIPLTDRKRPNGVICVRAVNTTNSNIFPTGQPFISYSRNEDLIRIRHISNLQEAQSYRLTLLVI